MTDEQTPVGAGDGNTYVVDIHALQARIAELEAELARYKQIYPEPRDQGGWHTATILAPSSEDWHGVIWALNQAGSQMEDFEQTLQRVEMPDGSWMTVDLDAGGRSGPRNVYLISSCDDAQEAGNDE